MGRTLEIQEFLRLLPTVPAADVRSPSEYLRAHIPGVMSLPLFSDEERAIIGTLYKHQGRERATLKGMEIAGPKMASYVTQASVLAPERRLMLHCWRGGMRSAAMAFTLETAGFEVMLLDGGYRSFRRLALELVQYPWKLRVLGGMTGSGKTQVLKHLQQDGLQVLDLEGMANHKGSAFGSIGQLEQPGTEH
ncbi:MAG TPA: rhodanese-like domain-containing protein, partial [Bacteroidales bacterium]|nr:rhodanese-like domain-containing protein [Bacteroidales bacterium]